MIMEATFTDISEWQKNIQYNTGGSRSKYIAIHPENNDAYFFKGSKETMDGEIRYVTEFWSEIVSSKVGQSLGFPLLDYNIAFDKNHKQKVGCLSKSMIESSSSTLTEGKTYLTGYNYRYNPDEDKKDYTFQFIIEALKKFKLEKYVENIIEIIVFDSIIGNSDRHQENWGIITDRDNIIIEIKRDKIDRRLLNKLTDWIAKSNTDAPPKFIYQTGAKYRFAPIYDSGCCLGREHTDERVDKILKDDIMLEAYINKGTSEIHWEGIGKKSNHFELIEFLFQIYPNQIRSIINRTQSNYKADKIKKIIDDIDKNLPDELINFKLSEQRKELMYKLVTLRTRKLFQLL